MYRLIILFTISLIILAQSKETYAAVPSYDKRLSNFVYPFETNVFKLSSQGEALEMTYMFLEPKPGKSVVTLFHGKNFNGAYWAQTASMLHELGYGVFIPDQIGFGKSSKPTNYQYSFAALANNTRLLMTELSIRNTIVVGHSMGGMLATRFTLLFPEFSDSLVLINPIGLENYLLYTNYTDIETVYRNELKKKPEMIVNYQKKNYYDGKWNAIFAKQSEFLQGWINGPDWPLLSRVNALTYDMIFTQPVIEEFSEIKVPTTLILGTRDRTAPGRANKKQGIKRELGRYDLLGNEIKKRNENIEVVELNALGHLPHIEHFERFKAPFLKAIQARSTKS